MRAFDKDVYRELKSYIRAWLKSGETLTEDDIAEWRRRNIPPPKQPSLFTASEVPLDPNVSLCPDCRGRGCRNCDDGVIVTKRLLTDRAEELEP